VPSSPPKIDTSENNTNSPRPAVARDAAEGGRPVELGANAPPKAKNPHGRPQTIIDEKKKAACEARDQGGSLRDAAKLIYDKKIRPLKKLLSSRGGYWGRFVAGRETFFAVESQDGAGILDKRRLKKIIYSVPKNHFFDSYFSTGFRLRSRWLVTEPTTRRVDGNSEHTRRDLKRVRCRSNYSIVRCLGAMMAAAAAGTKVFETWLRGSLPTRRCGIVARLPALRWSAG